MKKVKTRELNGAALDWAVAKIEWEAHDNDTNVLMVTVGDDNGWKFNPSTNWAQGGPIIEREGIEICPIGNGEWRGQLNLAGDWIRFYGDTPLIAAMRCYVASKLGDEVEIPEELT